jgi:hypothetical protein
MNPEWTITIDCADAPVLAAFWRAALGYIDAPPPPGFESTEDWLRHVGVPEEEWGDGAYIVDPIGLRPRISFLRVPEPKSVKNRLHLDLQVSGGRSRPQREREIAINSSAEELIAIGASIVQRIDNDGALDHLLMADPEGNEFCLV